jgi:tRNA U34 5-methylaminomethyl-2-thiouridine-forming methyltransferase MnmC
MHREIILTSDGSHTIAIPEMNVTYHSSHGAIQESQHVFIDAGFRHAAKQKPLRILEMGFGTGLNAFLTLIETEKINLPVHYTTIELFPLQQTEMALLNYCEQLNRKDLGAIFQRLHHCNWEEEARITDHFTLQKLNTSLLTLQPAGLAPFNLIYYDAFAPTAQPELWTTEIFEKLYGLLSIEGILVTYCSKGDVRRAMQAAGFSIEKIPGPRGKREMVRAEKRM